MSKLKLASLNKLIRSPRWSFWSFWASLLLGLGALPLTTGCKTFPKSALNEKKLLTFNSVWGIFEEIQKFQQDRKAFNQELQLDTEFHQANRVFMAWVTDKLEFDGIPGPEEKLHMLTLSLELKQKDLSNNTLRLETPLVPDLLQSSLSDGLFELHAFGDFRGTQELRSLIALLEKKLGAEGTKAQVMLLHMLGLLLIETETLMVQINQELQKLLEAAQKALPQLEKRALELLKTALKDLSELQKQAENWSQKTMNSLMQNEEALRMLLEVALFSLPEFRQRLEEDLEAMKKSLQQPPKLNLLKGIEGYLSGLPDFEKAPNSQNYQVFMGSRFRKEAGVAFHEVNFGTNAQPSLLKIQLSAPIHPDSLPQHAKKWIPDWSEGTRIMRLKLEGDDIKWEGFLLLSWLKEQRPSASLNPPIGNPV